MKLRLFLATIINSVILIIIFLAINNYSNLKRIFQQHLYQLGFKVDKIYINELSFVKITDVIDRLDFADNSPIVKLNKFANKKKLEESFWIDKANINILYPNIVKIHIIEKIPEFVWIYQNKYIALDKAGKILKILDKNELERFSGFILLAGENVRSVTDNLLNIIKIDLELHKFISKAIWVSNRRWNIEFIDGFTVKLPQEDSILAWQYFLKLNKEVNLLGKNIESLDLRVPEQTFMQLNLDDPLNKNLLNIL
jgi:cell division septal protein FtsQ